jgi:hypothetical protein
VAILPSVAPDTLAMGQQDCWPFFTQLPPPSPNGSSSWSNLQLHCSKGRGTSISSTPTNIATSVAVVACDEPPVMTDWIDSSTPVHSAPAPKPSKPDYHQVFAHICDLCCIESDDLRALVQVGCDDYLGLLSCLTLHALSTVKLTPVDNPHGSPYPLNWGTMSRCMAPKAYLAFRRFQSNGVAMTLEDWLHVTSDDMDEFFFSGGIAKYHAGAFSHQHSPPVVQSPPAAPPLSLTPSPAAQLLTVVPTTTTDPTVAAAFNCSVVAPTIGEELDYATQYHGIHPDGDCWNNNNNLGKIEELSAVLVEINTHCLPFSAQQPVSVMAMVPASSSVAPLIGEDVLTIDSGQLDHWVNTGMLQETPTLGEPPTHWELGENPTHGEPPTIWESPTLGEPPIPDEEPPTPGKPPTPWDPPSTLGESPSLAGELLPTLVGVTPDPGELPAIPGEPPTLGESPDTPDVGEPPPKLGEEALTLLDSGQTVPTSPGDEKEYPTLGEPPPFSAVPAPTTPEPPAKPPPIPGMSVSYFTHEVPVVLSHLLPVLSYWDIGRWGAFTTAGGALY